ncbi:MAG: NAD(P)/FAD-dependent oxidoreductase [Alphaproteobacteria bacterium]
MERLECDVVIVGGGLIGASTALHLCKLGRKVVLLERGFIGAQASGVNFGNVRTQNRYLPQLPLAMRAREVWGRLKELVGEDGEFSPAGQLTVAYDEAELAKLEDWSRAAAEYGVAAEMIGRNALSARFPWLGRDPIGASFVASDGHANPRLVAPAFGRAARAAGAEVREHCEVTAIGHDGRRFTVEAAGGLRVSAEALLNAAGAWGARIAADFGEPVPLKPLGPQVGVTEPVPFFLPPTVAVPDGSIYVRQVARGNIVYGGGMRPPSYPEERRAYALPGFAKGQFARLVRLVPAIQHLQLIRTWSGIEGYFPDMIPIMGPSATTPGLFHAFGFCGHGFALGPGVGPVMAELIAAGRSETPIADFTIARFRTA